MRDITQAEVGTTPLAWSRVAGASRLHTATLALRDGEGVIEILHACRVCGPSEVVARMVVRVGPVLAAAAAVRVGVDPDDPIVVSLLGPKLAAVLAATGDLPGGALRAGGDLHVVQRCG